MKKNERKVLKNNPGMADTLFELMFEKLWVAPHDPRRGDAALTEFERVARRMVLLLSDTDLTTVSAGRVQELTCAAEHLSSCVGRLGEAGLFPAGKCAEAADLVRGIEDEIRTKCSSVIAG